MKAKLYNLMLLGPYSAEDEGSVTYKGNKIFSRKENILQNNISFSKLANRVSDLNKNKLWMHISNINNQIYTSANKYFQNIDSIFTLLPLTTRMISSPGAVYGKEAISYTTDTSPIKLKWFDLEREAFLSESSQIYLEIALAQPNINSVYSIYNSFRK